MVRYGQRDFVDQNGGLCSGQTRVVHVLSYSRTSATPDTEIINATYKNN